MEWIGLDSTRLDSTRDDDDDDVDFLFLENENAIVNFV